MCSTKSEMDREIKSSDLVRVAPEVWEVPSSFRSDMRVAARLYADEVLLEAALTDRSIEQLINTSTLPGIVSYAIAMPDIHQGYGFPIGGVIATLLPEGVISPGGVGYDINCGAAEALRVAHFKILLKNILLGRFVSRYAADR